MIDSSVTPLDFDIERPADFSSVASDFAVTSDQAAIRDLAVTPDRSVLPDLSVPPDLVSPPADGGINVRPLGKAVVANGVNCGPNNSPLPISRCLKVTIQSCPGVADLVADVKISEPAGKPRGTIVFGSGGGGGALYEQNYGAPAINTILLPLLNAGFRIIQKGWEGQDGWLMGPGGPAHLACRGATLFDALHAGYHEANTPFCLTGNSGGSSEIGYVMSQYGLERIVDLAVPTSGPPHGRLDTGCLAGNDPAYLNQCPALRSCNGGLCVFTGGAIGIIDESYGVGTTHCLNHDNGFAATFREDSVWSATAALDYPRTEMRFIYGSADCSEAAPLGRLYANAVGSAKKITVVQNAPHAVPSDPGGATQVFNDLMAGCVLRH